MTLNLPTRELVGLLGDVYRFAAPDPDDTIWHRVILRWNETRLYAMAGDGQRLALMSWGPNDGDQPVIPGLETSLTDTAWELAIMPENAKEIVAKFKVSAKEGELPLRVDGSDDKIRIERDAEAGGVSLKSVTLARPWDDNGPNIVEMINTLSASAANSAPRNTVAYWGAGLADYCNPKVVRQRGPVVLHFGPGSTYVEIGDHFRGAIVQTDPARV